MARAKLSPILSSISGSIGNAVIQRSSGGFSVRTKPFVRYSASVAQLQIRANVQVILNAWHSLSDAQISQWKSAISYFKIPVAHNHDVSLTGYPLFLKHNQLLLAVGKSVMTSIAYYATVYQDCGFDVNLTPYGLVLDLDTAFDATKWAVLVKATPPLARYISYYYNMLRVVPAVFQGGKESYIGSNYAAVFGRQPVAGEYVGFCVQFINLKMPYSQAEYSQLITI